MSNHKTTRREFLKQTGLSLGTLASRIDIPVKKTNNADSSPESEILELIRESTKTFYKQRERIFHGHEEAGYAALCPEGKRTLIQYFSPDMDGYVKAIDAITKTEKMGLILYNPRLLKAA